MNMALEATHLRLALDLKVKYQIKDEGSYLAGSIYPDTRYITKLDRNLTHPHDYVNWERSTLDDFHKGWLTHLLGDSAQFNIIKQKFPEIFAVGPLEQDNDVWVMLTGVKVLQDLNDAQSFDIARHFPDSNCA